MATAQNFGGLGNSFSNAGGNNNGDQNNQRGDSAEQAIPPKLYMWHLDERLGTVLKMPVDTANYNFQNSNLTEGMEGHYNYLGNMGAPRLSRIFFERPTNTSNYFMAPYSFYMTPGDMKFTNSNIPYTNLAYYKGGGKEYGEERFKSYFSVNVNKKLAFGFNFDYLYGRGFYNNQSTGFFNFSLFGSYMSDHYDASIIYSRNYLKMNENGGITDDRYITSPEVMANGGKTYETQNIPTYLSSSSNRNSNYSIYFAHRYKIGFTKKTKVVEVEDKDPLSPANIAKKQKEESGKMESNEKLQELPPIKGQGEINNKMPKDMKAPKGMKAPQGMKGDKPERPLPPADGKDKAKKDSVITEFVPVTSIIPTIKYDITFHRFSSADAVTYKTTFFDSKNPAVNDTTRYMSVKNTFGLALLEGFNKWAKAGLTAFVSHKLSQYNMMDSDRVTKDKMNETEVFIGGELAKREGKALHYVINGEVGMFDKAIGQFRLNGHIDMNFHLLRDTVSFIARASISNTLPDFYLRHNHTKHYYWDDDLTKEFRTRLEGELAIEKLGTNLQFGIENIKNYTYLNASALPTQSSDNIQIITATLKQNFKLGILHLDNEVIWQKSSNSTIIPLPQLSLYHNLYLETKLAHKVLSVQLGADLRYFSKYFAPTYSPVLQQFCLQDESKGVQLGAYPIVNVYANLQLKRTRFFVQVYNILKGSGNAMSFYVPHYPINQSLFKIGLSWNFYD